MHPLLRLVLALQALFLVACARDMTPPGTFFASSPPGARVLIDGEDSGYVTPCLIKLDEDDGYRIRFQLSGFQPRVVRLEPNSRSYWISWDDGAMAPHGMRSFLFLSFGDLFVPFRYDDSHSPPRIFVRLPPVTE